MRLSEVVVTRGPRGWRGEVGRLGFSRMDRDGTSLIALEGEHGQGCREVVRLGAQNAKRVLDARLPRRHGELCVDIVFCLIDGQEQGLGEVEGIVEYGRRRQVIEEVAPRSGHGAGGGS